MAFGCAYFGVRDPDCFEADLGAMAGAGFGWVLLPFTQDDALWEVSTFALLVESARRAGLVAVISPWGGDDFGGEGVQTAMPTLEWIARAKATGARVLHVDEPRTERLTIGQVLDAWGDDGNAWLTVQPERAGILDPGIVERVAVLGTDAYEGSPEHRAATTLAFRERTGRLDLAWVQAFQIPAGGEPLVGATLRAIAALVPRVGVWAWKGSTGRGELRSADPGLVQAEVDRAIAAVAAGPAQGSHERAGKRS